MRTSYKSEDVTLLLKDITGMVVPQSTQEREQAIQNGRHYSEMLPIEYQPTPQYIRAYNEALIYFSAVTAQSVATLAHSIFQQRGKDVVLVSLARAGIPAGILLKWYFKKYFHLDLPHYAISIIRGRGIDHNAMEFILKKHPPETILFVDGWIGKGAILRELDKEMRAYPLVSSQLAVLSDPANLTNLVGTREDILIPSCCLNATVSGLISRTFLRDDLIGSDDFHGAVFYPELLHSDCSYDFLFKIANVFPSRPDSLLAKSSITGMDEVNRIADIYAIADINFIKPGIGETTRVLLRRVPWKVLIDTSMKEHPSIALIRRLAEERNVPIEYCHLNHYLACGLIKTLSDT